MPSGRRLFYSTPWPGMIKKSPDVLQRKGPVTGGKAISMEFCR